MSCWGGVHSQSITSTAASVPASTTASPTPTVTPLPGASGILFQVTSQQWQRAITTWRLYPAGSWKTHAGVLTNTSKGVKFCENEVGVIGCAYQSLIAAPYHIPATSYALQARMRFRFRGRFGFTGSLCCNTRGILLFSPGKSAAPVPWLFAGDNGISDTCGPPVLFPLAPCGTLVVLSSPIFFGYQDDGRWHVRSR
jgi:hypothetical protein